MNKTVNINLAGLSFHIDEDAYGKLSRYLAAIRRSLKGADGSEEIMQDIESRIAELFAEKMEAPAQVVTLRILDEVIAVMGQPEDYEVDDEIFNDVPPASEKADYSQSGTTRKQLFRDVDNKYIGGVSSGLGHYLGIDAIWIRLLWVLLVLAGLGSPIVVYILLWILMPPALTTSQKLKMMGEPINISNIERKFKEGFDNVADRVKNVDYDKYGNKIKTGTSQFFDSLGEAIVVLFKLFAKFIGVVIIVVSLLTMIGLVIAYFTVTSIDFIGNNEWAEYVAMVSTGNTPVWIWALLFLLAIGIPFFALFVLGLRLLISNLKPMAATIKIVLIVVWALSIIGLSFLGIKQATEKAYDGNFIEEREVTISPSDTLTIEMRADTQFSQQMGRNTDLEIKYTKDDTRVIYSTNIAIEIKPASGPEGKIVVEKEAVGINFLEAKKRAESIVYTYSLENSQLILDSFFTTDPSQKFRDQRVEVTLYLPEGTTFYADGNVSKYYSFNSQLSETTNWDNRSHYFTVGKDGINCLDCEEPRANLSPETAEEADTLGKSSDSIRNTIDKSWEQEVKERFRQD